MDLPEQPDLAPDDAQKLQQDYIDWGQNGWPDDWEQVILERYRVDLSSEYAGYPIRNPFGKASGQLSMVPGQVRDDVAAGLGFVVLKTVIAQDEGGAMSMGAWAIPEARMVVEPIRGQSGEEGWTVTWKGRGWSRSFEDYLEFVSRSQQIAAPAGTLIVPSCKFHLPAAGEPFREDEYRYTLSRLSRAYGGEMPLEKDFSPTLAGSDLARQQEQILNWLREVPRIVRRSADQPVRLGLKLFNACFDDAFQETLLETIHTSEPRCDYYVFANRLFDPDREFAGHRGVAYGGPDLSDRNLRVMDLWQQTSTAVRLPWSATGNIINGRLAMQYALLGASSFQMHTLFQLPDTCRTAKVGNRTRRALHELLLHPTDGFLAWVLHVGRHTLAADGVIRYRDIVGAALPDA